MIICVRDSRHYGVTTGCRWSGCRTIIGQSDTEARGHCGSRSRLGIAVEGCSQVTESHGGGGLADDQRARCCALVVGVIDRGDHGIATGSRGRRGRSLVSETHAQASGNRGSGGSLRGAIISGGQITQSHRSEGLADHQRARGSALISRVIDRSHHRIASGSCGSGRGTIVSHPCAETRRNRGDRDSLGSAVRGRRKVTECHGSRRGALTKGHGRTPNLRSIGIETVEGIDRGNTIEITGNVGNIGALQRTIHHQA